MKKTLLSAMIFLAAIAVFSQNLRRVETIFKPGDEYFGMIDRLVEYFPAGTDEVVKREVYFSEKLRSERGVQIQNEYLKDGVIYKFEMLLTPANTAERGIKMRTDFVDSRDKITEILLTFEDGVELSFTERHIETIDKFYPQNVDEFIALYGEYSFDERREQSYMFESPVFAASLRVKISDVVSDVTEKEKFMVSGWARQRRWTDYSHLYNKKVQVEQNGRVFWILLQDSIVGEVTDLKEALIPCYYLGGIAEGPVFTAVGFFPISGEKWY